MIDYDDVSDFALFGPVGFIGLVILIALFCIALENDKECSTRTCPAGMAPKLMENDCLCTTKAK